MAEPAQGWPGPGLERGCEDLYLAAVGEQFAAGHEAGALAGQEEGGLGDLGGVGDPAEGQLGADVVQQCPLAGASRARPRSPGVSVGPGTRTFTRIRRPASSAGQTRANWRRAALDEE